MDELKRLIREIEQLKVEVYRLKGINARQNFLIKKLENPNIPQIKSCSICLKDIKYDHKITLCNHLFHGKCLKKWTCKNKTCPLCRAKIK
jgi:hypothetical protein